MPASRRIIPLLLFALLAWACAITPVRAQNGSSSRFVFADTTLLRDTLNLSFEGLFELAHQLDVTPDSLRAYAIRYELSLDRLAFLSDSMGMPVDSVGPVLERERYNPLVIKAERLTSFGYNTSYTITRQSTSWNNSSTYDMVRGPFVLHNVTGVRIDQLKEGSLTSFHRNKTSNTETGWRITPDLSLGARVNLARTESERLGSQRTTSNNELQGSLRAKRDFAENLHAEANVFGGPFSEPKNSLSNAAKRGFGTMVDGRMDYQGPRGLSVDFNGSTNVRIGHAELPSSTTFPITDVRWNAGGTVSAFPSSFAPLRLNYSFNGDRTQRPLQFTQISSSSPPDTVVQELLLSEPSGQARIEASTQIRTFQFGSVTLTGAADRSTRLNASERKQGIVFEQGKGRGRSLSADGQFQVGAWSIDGQFSDSRPTDESPRRAPVEVVDSTTQNITNVLVDYRELSVTRVRSVNGRLTRRLTPRVQVNARADVTLTTYRYDVTDSSYIAETGDGRVQPSDAHDDYRQSYRLETVYSPSGVLSTTLALDVSRVLNLFLESNRSGTNREDRIYRLDWLWTYRLMRGLTANQRNQIAATYGRNIYDPNKNRLGMSYTSVTTLNAILTPRMTMEITHNAVYGPNGAYLRAADGIEYFNVSDQANDYTLSGAITYAPVPALSFNISPVYVANQRDDRSTGTEVPTLRRRQLNFAGGASLNIRVGSGRLTGTLSRVIETRRDIRYASGVASTDPTSGTDYWTGQILFSWNLR